jgi:hypothetical protein
MFCALGFSKMEVVLSRMRVQVMEALFSNCNLRQFAEDVSSCYSVEENEF